MAKKGIFQGGVIQTYVIVFLVLVLLGFSLIYLSDVTNSKGNKKQVRMEEYEDKPILKIIYAYSKTCPHCIKFEKTFEVTSKEFASSVENMNVDIQKHERSSIPSKYMEEIDGFPTVLLFKNDVLIKKMVGNMSSKDFMEALKSVV